ncbi:MAG: FAD-dependent oxidoreductase [Ruminococcaceae bacterium]|nr:FAD-dependent oxidoreductase [Oscillospiraceae bacterium]
MRTLNYETELCVVGGGLSGLCCAIAASRHGIKTILVHDRAVLGGNASSEIRMHICGAKGQNNRETGIIEEIVLENFYRNPEQNYSIWDTVLYEKAMAEENLTLLLNTSCLDATMNNEKIKSIKAWQSNAETFHIIKAKYFADCSGDSILAPLSNAEYRYGREAKSEFSETIPPVVSDKKTMGMSCLMQIRETDHKVEFIPPEWAYKYETEEMLKYKPHELIMEDNFWWLEVGGEWDCIHDTDRCRDELLKIAFGVWDHIKNYGNHGMDNHELEWIGMLPGKRESRRYVGEYTVTENDVKNEGRFNDIVAYGGWPMDDHFPGGFYYQEGYPTIFHPAPCLWGLPLRCMISKNIQNLVFAGRNISITHAALSSSRVMATCSLLGQALGTAVAQAVISNTDIRKIDIKTLQNTLMNDDCFIPGHEREVSELSKNANCSAEIVRNGQYRKEENLWIGSKYDTVTYTFDSEVKVSKIRLVFDSDLNRETHNMLSNYYIRNEQPKPLPKTLIKEYKVVGEKENGETFEIEVLNNRKRLVYHNVDWSVKKVTFVPIKTHGTPDFRLFGFEVE